MKTNWELHGNFICNYFKEDKRVGFNNLLKHKSKKILIDHSQVKANKWKIKLNLLIRFSKFYSCFIYTDQMSVMFKEWLILLSYWLLLWVKWGPSVFSRIKLLEYLFSKDCILLMEIIQPFIARLLIIFWKMLIPMLFNCFKRNILILISSLLNGFIHFLVEEWILRQH